MHTETTERRGTPLHKQILFGLVVGAIGGVLASTLWRDAPALLWLVENVAQPVGQVFLRLLFMVVVPLVFTALGISPGWGGSVVRPLRSSCAPPRSPPLSACCWSKPSARAIWLPGLLQRQGP